MRWCAATAYVHAVFADENGEQLDTRLLRKLFHVCERDLVALAHRVNHFGRLLSPPSQYGLPRLDPRGRERVFVLCDGCLSDRLERV